MRIPEQVSFTVMPDGANSFASVRANPFTAARTELDSSDPSIGCFTADEKKPSLATATIATRPCSPRCILPVLSKPPMLSRNAAPRQIQPHRRIAVPVSCIE
jgi:hypothetical protein